MRISWPDAPRGNAPRGNAPRGSASNEGAPQGGGKYIPSTATKITIDISGAGMASTEHYEYARPESGQTTVNITLPEGAKTAEIRAVDSGGNTLSYTQSNFTVAAGQTASVNANLGVGINDSGFTPSSITVTKGTTLQFVNNGSVPHTVTEIYGTFNSGSIAAGSSWSSAFNTAGTFNYRDAYNPALTGTIVVTDTNAPPSAPSGLSAVAASSGQINLTWTRNSTNETGFKIERKTGLGGTYAQIAAVGAGVTSYNNTGLSDGITYYYKIRAYNDVGDSSYSNETNGSTVLAAPSDLSATRASTSQINLAWTDNSSAETGFKIERKTGAGGAYAQIAAVGAGVTSYNNTGLLENTTYYYKVRAYNDTGDSSYSNEANATTTIPDYVKLLAHFEGENGSTVFTDSSNWHHTITANGNVHIDTSQSKVGTSSANFDGNGDYLTIASSDDYAFGSGDFIVQGWFRFNTLAGEQTLIGGQQYSFMHFMTGGRLAVYLSSDGGSWNLQNQSLTSKTDWDVGRWYHIALARSGATVKVYINGVEDWSYAIGGTALADPSGIFIGKNERFGIIYANGWMDELSIAKGNSDLNYQPAARTTGDFLVAHFEGENGSTVFTDDSPSHNVITPYGNVHIDTSQKAAGNSSANFDGNGDYLSLEPSDDFAFGSSDFTIQGWYRWSTLDGEHALIGGRQCSFMLFWTGGRLAVYLSSSRPAGWNLKNQSLTNKLDWSAGTWYKIALVRTGTVIKVYVNDVEDWTYTIGGTALADPGGIFIGKNEAGGIIYWNGWIDELTISR